MISEINERLNPTLARVLTGKMPQKRTLLDLLNRFLLPVAFVRLTPEVGYTFLFALCLSLSTTCLFTYPHLAAFYLSLFERFSRKRL